MKDGRLANLCFIVPELDLAAFSSQSSHLFLRSEYLYLHSEIFLFCMTRRPQCGTSREHRPFGQKPISRNQIFC